MHQAVTFFVPAMFGVSAAVPGGVHDALYDGAKHVCLERNDLEAPQTGSASLGRRGVRSMMAMSGKLDRVHI
jgi:hypothetical protein